MATISTLGGLSSIDTLVNRYLEVERRPIDKLETEKSDHNTKLAIFSDFRSELKTLQDRLSGFTAVGAAAKFGSRIAISSNPSIVTAEATTSAGIGVNSIFISRIAQRETVLTDRFNKNQKTLAQDYKDTTQRFTIKVGDNDPVEIAVTFSDKHEKDESVLRRIGDAINAAEAGITANVLKVDSSNVRLTITANETGSENEIVFSGGSSLINTLGFVDDLEERKAADNSRGGYIVQETGNLDANFTLNGVEITQGSNDVDDVLNGVTISLLKAQEEGDQPETITIDIDGADLKKQIEGFIEDYNSSISYINSKSGFDSVTRKRGSFTGNFTITNFRIKMREITSSSLTSGTNKTIKNLRQLGISIERDGTLKIDDDEELDNKIAENSDEIRSFFSDQENGLAQRLNTELKKFTRFGGIISDNEKGLKNKISNLDTRTKRFNDRLEVRETSLRRQF
ncbi:flagellar filament capping protein FliD, partial [candidate division KSB1 bacterium]